MGGSIRRENTNCQYCPILSTSSMWREGVDDAPSGVSSLRGWEILTPCKKMHDTEIGGKLVAPRKQLHDAEIGGTL